jgi:integrase
VKRRLTDRTLRSLKRAELGKRYEVMDTETRQFGVRVNDRGVVAFILVARFPGSKNPVRRHFGEYPSMSLAEARERANEWRNLLKQGKDPTIEEEKQKQAEQRRHADTFATVADSYFAFIRRKGLRRADEIERLIRREFVAHLGNRPVTDITWVDLKARIDAAISREAKYEAHRIFANASRLFNWIREQGTLITASPCDGRRPAKIIGPKEARTRVFDDDEVRALWAASGKIGYPFGPLVRMLLLTGQRRTEVSDAQWRELDFDKKLWSIPVARMKSKAAHFVPLTDDVLTLLVELPRFRGDYLFSATYGHKAVRGFTRWKRVLDQAMSKALGREVEPFVLHDIRRTVRTRLASLPISDKVAELAIGHAARAPQGLQSVRLP